ncbi:MAG: DUF4974 domain-containing protein [Chitinophagaceae bacterium]|nr:DUF4974 domain-containing protein [Chitinophagaceae bacterium]
MNKQILEILTKYQNATCSDAELKLLDEWYHQLEISNQTISNQTINDNDVVIFTDSMLKEFREKVGQGVKIIPFYRQPIFRMVAAASVLFVIFFGTYFYVTKPSSKTLVNQSIVKKDVMAPSSSKATITLANGQIVALDGISSGTLVASQGAVNVMKTEDGQIVYKGTSKQIAYNTLYNPRGSKVISLRLNDGSIVWLNSQSSIRYPVAFVGDERQVEITGEAYFEVAKNLTKKFIVASNGLNIEVLGTHFNVNSYNDNKNIKVTLLEGSVKIIKGAGTFILKPGQQAQVANEIQVLNGANIESVMAWKNGFFSFSGTSVEELMNILGRWYNVEIVFNKSIPNRQFGGQIATSANLSQVVKVLNESELKCALLNGKLVID